MPKEGRLFNLGMNKDVSPHLLKNGMYVDAFNLHIGKTGNGVDLTAENVKSTKEADDSYTLPSGVNRIIGMWDDVKGRRTIIFLWNSEGSHRLIEYNYTTEETTTIIEDNDYSSTAWSGSSVSYSYADVVTNNDSYWYCVFSHTSSSSNEPGASGYFWAEEGDYIDLDENSFPQIDGVYRDGELLIYWTDNNSEPKYINVDRYLNGSSGTDYPAVHRKRYFEAIPYTPEFPVYQMDYDTDSSITSNISGNYYQFRYQWEYRDGRRSAWSPISAIPLPQLNSLSQGNVLNKIDVQVPFSEKNATNNTVIINRVNVAVREVGSGNSGDWYIFNQTEIDSSTSFSSVSNYGTSNGAQNYPYYISVEFNGNNSLISISVNEVSQYFSWVPKLASSQSIVGENTFLYGGITEGNNNITDGTISISWQVADFGTTGYKTFGTSDVDTGTDEITITSHGFVTGQPIRFNDANRPSPLAQNTTYYIIYVDSNTIQIAASYEDAISSTAVNLTTTGSGTMTISPDPSAGSFKGFKRGAKYKFGLVYSDGKGRLSDVYTKDDWQSTATFYHASLDINSNVAIYPRITISHQPPDWAETYQIVYSQIGSIEKNGSTGVIYQFPTRDANTFGGATTAWSVYDDEFVYLELGFVSGLDSGTPTWIGENGLGQYYSGRNLDTYSFQKGDRVRLIGAYSGSSAMTYTSTLYDAPIIDYIQDHKYLTYLATSSPGPDAVNGPVLKVTRSELDTSVFAGATASSATLPVDDVVALIEVYRPSYEISESQFWYEIGTTYKCGYDSNGERVHLAINSDTVNNTDQVFGGADAVVNILSGDFYIGLRPTVYIGAGLAWGTNGVAYSVMEIPSPDNFEVSRSNDSGRVNIISKESSQNIETARDATIRISQPLIDGTNINGFSMFYGTEFKDYNVNHGRINKLFSQKEYLTVFQETRTSTIPINRIQWSDAAGATTVALSTSLLGAIQYFPQQFGIGDNATSHSAYGEKQFFYDLRRNAILMIRGSSQLDVISELGVDSWVDNISEISNGYVNRPKIYGVYDQEFMEYISCVDYSAIANGVVSNVDSGSSQITVTVSADQWSAFSLSVDTGSTVTVRYDDSGTTAETTESVNAYPLNAITLDVSDTSIYTVSETVQIRYEQKDTIAYSDKFGFWSGRYPFTPEMFGSAGTKVLSSNNGVLWVHNDGDVSTYGNIYGTAYAATIQFPFNESPATVKNPLNIEIRTNDLENWSVTEIINNTGQQSSLETTDFTSIEGVLYAPILRDINTPNKTNPITQGDKLFGEYHLVTLSNDSTDYVRLYSSGLNYTPSYLP